MIHASERGAWRQLEAKLRPFVTRRVRSPADVDDVLQDIFVRMQRGLSALREDERFGPWVYRVAHSAIVEHHKRDARHPWSDRREEPQELPCESAEDERAAECDLARHIAPFVAMLPSPYREALTLTELQGLTHKQAAEMMGVSLTAMKSRVARGRTQLRRSLEECCHIALDARGRVLSCEPREDGRLPSGIETKQFMPRASACGGCMSPSTTPLAPLASMWTRADIADESHWIERLSPALLSELDALVRALDDRAIESLALSDIPAQGELSSAGLRWRSALERGLGFVLLRGLPVQQWSESQQQRAYVLLGLLLGTLVPQNLRGELLTHVRDTGADPSDPSVRLYTTRAAQDFHTDGADIIGLLCLRTAREGGLSRIASSSAIVAEIQRARPDLFAVLFESFPWRYQEPGSPPFVIERPICTIPARREDGAVINTFFIPWYIRRSQELEDAPRLSPAQTEAIALIEQLANDPRFYVDMRFEPGDIQWLKNAAILHKRTAYEDFEQPERKRHLLRLWLSAADFDDGDAQLRGGVTSATVRAG